MAELKTKPTQASVHDFLTTVSDTQKKQDCEKVIEIMQKVTQKEPIMWGANMVGFGTCEYQYASGQTGTWFPVGFAPRKNDITLYFLSGVEKYADLLEQLGGKHKTGKSCLHIKKFSEINLDILEEMIEKAFLDTQK
ncbi:MAG: DUF1801 domain-containing protein [Raineya sp.]|jgi:hypothetical protein|nr:DUF1801 domain-containing protein [Raineya sp.]